MILDKNMESERLMQYESFRKVIRTNNNPNNKRWLKAAILVLLLSLFLPWTQTIKSRGEISSTDPQERPQEVNTIIPGRILKWYVRDGAMVKAGDTLLQLAEVKDDYLDPQLAERTAEQLKSKNDATEYYKGKANATNDQLAALQQGLVLKTEQLKNKLKQYSLQVRSDSMAMLAANSQLKISELQLKRQKELYDAGLKSLTEYEQRQQYYQDALAKKISSENKYYSSRNELFNIQLELSAVRQDYAEKLSKTSGEKFAALSQAATGEAEVSKLQNQLHNYRTRNGFHYIIAPQSGQIIQTLKAGIGEIVKDGETLLSIVPRQFEHAIEMFVTPNDLPLLSQGQSVRIQFDGFPAIVFSGWPSASYGVFGGEIVAIDNKISANGKFRVWVKPVKGQKPWPAELKFGTGCQSIALLKNVPVWYELWRQLNGFPPDFYKPETSENAGLKKK